MGTNISSSSSIQPGNWSFILGAKVPHRVRVFAWRVCRGILPTLSNLHRRKCQVMDICPCCEMHAESDMHILLECDMARQIWSLSDLPWGIIAGWHGSAEAWIRHVAFSLDSVDYQLFLVIACLGMKIQSASSSSTTWNPPPNGVVKVNFDGAMLSNMCGVVAAREAIELVAHGGWQDVILEGDCAQVISKLRNPCTDSSLISSVVYDIKLLCSCFHSVSFSHVMRTGNRVAHTLARLATFSLEGSVDHPASIIPILVAEYSAVA
ncbi:hypothetical protein BUALT_Bualt15G0121900 [Buddleja alternifolia]|uniref:RNase H type-1 domain-containing protein n=1 Tax=Buddleja alternifolia TaxID=168488 RepID=A0AAV6WJU1_9LAMI|nr:hypothetical protein BUALT_Bualt15G0121900 [Buddleja alternifolia]